MKKVKKYVCTECRSEYYSAMNEIPHIVVWTDGHVCIPKLYAEYEDKKIEKVKLDKEDELWTTWYN
jgi:hypothetical protein